MNKRLPVKWIRDLNKRKYNKGSECALCGTYSELQFHHFYSITLLFEKWLKTNKISVTTDDDVLAIRDQFSAEHTKEMFDETVTLCKTHHAKLHQVYGITPALTTVDKQKCWINTQAKKLGRIYEFEGMAD
jgi:hypothetical protein